jgi:hypothetical protein
MPGSLSMRSRRAEGSSLPRLVGVGIVGAIAVGGVVYLGVANHQHTAGHGPRRAHRHPTLSARVVAQQTVGLINFGPYDDRDGTATDRDDHPLLLQPAKDNLLRFALIPSSMLVNGQPQWTADQMADGTEIFIYNPTGMCLAVATGTAQAELMRCTAVRSQRWRPVHQATYAGQPFAAYANAQTGDCLTAPARRAKANPPGQPDPATLAACGPARTRSQEIAFWWPL